MVLPEPCNYQDLFEGFPALSDVNQLFTKSIISFVFKKKTIFCQKLLIGCLLDENKVLYLQPKEQKRK